MKTALKKIETQNGLPEFPIDWPTARLGDLFQIQQGKALNAKHRNNGTQRPFLRTANVFWGRLDLQNLDQMSFTADEERRLALSSGDLLTCEGGDVGRTAIWRNELLSCFYQNHLHRLRTTRADVEPEFYMRWMETAIRLLRLYGGTSNKTTIPNLSKTRLAAFAVPHPSVAEQRVIAGMLRVVQRTIEANGRVIAATRQLKASLLQHFFTYGPVPFEEADRLSLKDTTMGLIPRHWDVQPLRHLTDRPKYGLTATARDEVDGPRFLRITDIQNGTVKWSQVPSCVCSNEYRTKYALRPGDLLVARIGATTGKTFLVRDAPPAVFASYLIRIRAREGVDPGFLLRFTETAAYWKQINAAKGGRLKQGVNIPVLENLLIPVPTNEEQQMISSSIDVVEHRLAAEEKQRDALNTLFQSMLHDLVTGKVRLPQFATNQ